MRDQLMRMSRPERKAVLRSEEVARRSGQWGSWEAVSLPSGIPGGNGWTREIRVAYRNKVFAVLERRLGDGTIHLAVSSLSEVRPTWWEMQRIKNEIAGETATAVEVYPPQGEVVDEADMFHLWVLPQALPFSLAAPQDGEG